MTIDLNKVLVTGGGGMVASYIDFGIKAGKNTLDVTNLEQVSDFVFKNKPEAIIHLAALVDMAKCESEPEQAYKVNTVGTYNLALSAKKVGAKMVYVSTDAVFPNSIKPHTVQDVPSPDSVYGHSKYLGELAVKGISTDFIIARTSWVFGGGREKDKKFVGKFISQLGNPEVKAVNDEFSSPTYAKDLVDFLKKLILEDKIGIFHVVNSGTASRFEMAEVIAKTLKKDIKIHSVSGSEFTLQKYQKSSGGLASNLSVRPWQDALVEYIQNEWL